MASNLLCRLPNPRKFITDVKSFLHPYGILVLISPYSWLPEYTETSQWFGGKYNNESLPLDSFDELVKFIESNNQSSQPEVYEESNYGQMNKLTASLNLIHQNDNISFLIREHERKFQLGVSHVSAWQKYLV